MLICSHVNTENCTEYHEEKNAFVGPISVHFKEDIFWRNVRGNILVLFLLFFKVQISFQSKYVLWQLNAFCEDVNTRFES